MNLCKELPCESDAVGTYLQSFCPGQVWLFFGCRNENDFLYKDVLEKRRSSGVLTVSKLMLLVTAFTDALTQINI